MNTSPQNRLPAVALGSTAKVKFHPRHDILREVVVGLFWLHLDPPPDTSRGEMENVVRRLIQRIQTGSDEWAVTRAIASLQSDQFCQPIDIAVTRELACRTVALVHSAGTP
ncbi:MAG TPA: hypothetical protein VGM26_11925 [Rhizomicrobium sp.]|jgi:hypothetical protein